MPGRRAGSDVAVYARLQEPKTGQQKVQLSSKTKHFAYLGNLFIIYLWGLCMEYSTYTYKGDHSI